MSSLKILRKGLLTHFSDEGCSSDVRKSVRIATWNIREFGGSKFLGRDFESLYYMAEIIANFDLLALQEVRADLREFKRLMRILGPDWDFVATDVTDGAPGNGERMIFLYNRRYVQFTNIAGELTLKEGAKIRAAFGERLNLLNNISVKIPQNEPTLSGTYDAKLKSFSGGKKLNADLEIDLPDRCVLSLPPKSRLVVKKNTKVDSPSRGKAKVVISRNVSGEKYALRFPEDTFDDSFRQFARTPYFIIISIWMAQNKFVHSTYILR